MVSQPRYAPGSHFQSCPAATGEADPQVRCGTYPDGAHRCRHDRQPPHHRHGCLCEYAWLCVAAEGMTAPEVEAMLHPARHAA